MKKVIRQKFQSLQLLRAFAALMVVFFHITGSTQDVFKVSFLGDFFYFGSSGVQIFFVLSGFIITYTSWNQFNTGKIRKYFKRRTSRIYLIYWVTITFFLVPMILTGFQTGHDLGFISLLNIYLLLPGHEMLNGVSWSLSYELYFYLLFGLLIIDVRFLYFLCLILLLSLLNLLDFISFKSQLFNFLFAFNNFYFLFGVISAIILIYGKMIESKQLAKWLLILTFLLYVILGYLYHIFFLTQVAYGLLSMAMIYLCLLLEKSYSIAENNWFVLLGDASYVLYLIHLPILRVCHKILGHKIEVTDLGIITLINFLLIILISIFSVKVHQLVEKPLIQFFR